MRTSFVALLLATLAGQARASTTIPPPPPVPPVPHVDTVDAGKATAVRDALSAVFSSQGLPSLAAYAVPSLVCQLLTVPMAPQAYSCSLDVTTADGARRTLQIQDTADSSLAEKLFEALSDAGATYLDDPHYFRMTLANLQVSSEAVHFDDKSKWTPPPQPNVQVTGAVADRLLSALDGLNLDDSDRTLFLICMDRGRPECSYQLHQRPGARLDAATSAALWSAIKDAARSAGYRPARGSVDQLWIINASAFSYDGTTLAFVLVGDT